MPAIEDFKCPAIVIDRDGDARASNRAAEALFGSNLEQVVSRIKRSSDKTGIGGVYGHLSLNRQHYQVVTLASEGDTTTLLFTSQPEPEDLERQSQFSINRERQANLLHMTEKLAKVGFWHMDVASEEVFWSDEVYLIHGETREHYHPNAESLVAHTLAGEADELRRYMREAIEYGRGFQHTYRIRRPDSQRRWIRSRASVDSRAPSRPVPSRVRCRGR